MDDYKTVRSTTNYHSDPETLNSEGTASQNRNWRSLFLSVFCLIAVILCTFSRVPTFAFVRWDDNIHVFENPYFRDFKLAEIGHFWRYPYEQLYVPLSYSVFGLLSLAARLPAGSADSNSTGLLLDPRVFHIFNLLLHVVNTILVFLLVRRLVRSDAAALIGALVFGVHPLQVESVAWISELRARKPSSISWAS